MQAFGVPRSVGQIYGLLFASRSPLSFTDIVEQLDISKGSASQGLKLLRSLGAAKAVHRSNIVGQQANNSQVRDYYEPELSLRKLVSGILQERVSPLAIGAHRLTHLRKLARAEGVSSAFMLDRVRRLEEWRTRFNIVLPVFSALLGSKKGK